MNLSGAKKLSHYIGPILLENGAVDRRDDADLSRIWDEKLVRYEEAASK